MVIGPESLKDLVETHGNGGLEWAEDGQRNQVGQGCQRNKIGQGSPKKYENKPNSSTGLHDH